jgi:hypothetical protein
MAPKKKSLTKSPVAAPRARRTLVAAKPPRAPEAYRPGMSKGGTQCRVRP